MAVPTLAGNTDRDQTAMPISRALLKSKLKATALHVSLSLAIFAVLLYLMLVHWYPGLFFALDGGWQGVRIMLFVDVVLGPTLTFLVYNPAKRRRELLTDFAFIGLVQLAAVAYGIHAVHSRRPVALAFNANQLFTVRAEPLARQGVDLDQLRRLDTRWPVQVYAEPQEDAQAQRALDRMFKEGLLESQQFELYEPWDEHVADIVKASAPLREVTRGKAAVEAEVQAFAARLGARPEELVYLYFAGEYAQGWIVLDRQARLVGTIDMQAV